jgi:hypothetical protein
LSGVQGEKKGSLRTGSIYLVEKLSLVMDVVGFSREKIINTSHENNDGARSNFEPVQYGLSYGKTHAPCNEAVRKYCTPVSNLTTRNFGTCGTFRRDWMKICLIGDNDGQVSCGLKEPCRGMADVFEKKINRQDLYLGAWNLTKTRLLYSGIHNINPGARIFLHLIQLALHNFELLPRRLGLTAGINRQGYGQASNCSGSSSGDNPIVPIKASYESPQWTIDKPLAVFGYLIVVAFGYLSFAWGGGAVMLWRNPLGLLSGGIAMLLGIACIGHGLWHLVH